MTAMSRLDRALDWMTARQHRLVSFSILRILYGVALLALLVPSLPDRALLWGDASFWVDPEARRRWDAGFDLLLPKDSPAVFDLAFFALVTLAVLFTVGCGTRLVSPLLLALLVSLQANNPYALNGGDTLLRLTLLFMMFANLSERLSVDAVLRRRRIERGRSPIRLVPACVSNAAHNAGLLLCGFQIIVVYVVSGVWKLSGSEWLDGTALFYAMRLEAFTVYPMVNEALWQSGLLIWLATFVALWTQTLFPVALLWRPARAVALVALMLMHLGIAVLMGLWTFSLAMIALDMLFVRDTTWASLRARLATTRLGGWGAWPATQPCSTSTAPCATRRRSST